VGLAGQVRSSCSTRHLTSTAVEAGSGPRITWVRWVLRVELDHHWMFCLTPVLKLGQVERNGLGRSGQVKNDLGQVKNTWVRWVLGGRVG
jgi:hypothetical protein